MLYLLFVLTFLAGIIFYGLSPSDKSLEMTSHQAEGMIISFLAQHQAAKDYLYTWLGVGPNNNDTSNLQNSLTNSLKAEVDASKKPTMFNFEEMMPKNITSDMCAGNTGVPGTSAVSLTDKCLDEASQPIPGFVSRVICTNSDGTSAVDCSTAAKRYVITYGGWEECTDADVAKDICTKPYKRPSWWPRPGTRMRRFESWRKAIANRTRGSISCGTLVEVETGKWCIDNGETVYKDERTRSACMKQIPSAVINAMPDTYRVAGNPGLNDLLFCISEFKQGVQPGHYASTPIYFYDGLSNIGLGEHDKSNNLNWKNLGTRTTGSPAQPTTILTKFTGDNTFVSLTGRTALLDTGISLSGTTYTLTILAKVKPGTGTFSLFTGQDGADVHIFQWQQEWSCAGPEAGFVFKHAVENGHDADCFTSTHVAKLPQERAEIVSWTFVVGNCSEESGYSTTDTCMSVYENAVHRITRKKATFNGTLKIGTADAQPGADIYSIRYYGSALTPEQIQQNFKVDQKRFGLEDDNNAGLEEKRTATYEEGTL